MERKIGVYICHCGSNIAGTVDVEKVAEFARGLKSVAVARNYKYMCSDPGQNMIKNDIKALGLIGWWLLPARHRCMSLLSAVPVRKPD